MIRSFLYSWLGVGVGDEHRVSQHRNDPGAGTIPAREREELQQSVFLGASAAEVKGREEEGVY